MTTAVPRMTRRDADVLAERQRAREFAAEADRERRLGAALDRLPAEDLAQLAGAIIARYPIAGRWWASGAWRTPHNILRDLMLLHLDRRRGEPRS